MDNLDPEMAELAQKLSNMRPVEAPKDLVARTVDRVMKLRQPVKRVFILLRPITHPLARIAAAACIIFVLSPLTDIDQAAPLGSKIEERIIGAEVTDSVEVIVDDLLITTRPGTYQQSDLDAMMGVTHSNSVRHQVFHRGNTRV